MENTKRTKRIQPLWWDRLGWRVAMISVATWLIAVTIDHSPLRRNVVDAVTMRVGHTLRDALGFAPSIDERLNMITIDDVALEKMQNDTIGFDAWAKLIDILDSKGVTAVLIDDHFTMSMGQGYREFVRQAERSKVKIYARALLVQQNVVGRTEIDLDEPAYDLLGMLKPVEEEQRRYLSDVNWMPVEGGKAYGPREELRPAFTSLGHNLDDSLGYFKPFIRINKMRAIRHFGFLAADEFSLQGTELFVNGVNVPVLNARIPINFPSATNLQRISLSITKVLAQDPEVDALLSPGDVAIVLPHMYTGGRTYVDTPLGAWPRGYLYASIVNSTLTGQWFKPVYFRPVWHLLASIFGCLVGMFMVGREYWLATVLISISIGTIGLTAFVVFSLQAPMIVTSLCFALSSLLVYGERLRRAKVAQLRIEQELETAQFVQESFVPERRAESRHMKVVGEYVQARECSGDWWGRFSLGRDRELIMVGDALGHGVPAALVTSMAYSVCRSLVLAARRDPSFDLSPADILSDFNKVLNAAVDGEYSMTLVVADLDFRTGTLRYANAGHQFPVLIPKDPDDFRIKRKVRAYQKISELSPVWLQKTGPIAGLSAESEYENTALPMRPGDKYFFYTDGVIEAKDGFGNVWGVRTLIKRLLRIAHRDVDDIGAKLMDQIVHHVEGREFEDDLTIVIAEVNEDWHPLWSVDSLDNQAS